MPRRRLLRHRLCRVELTSHSEASRGIRLIGVVCFAWALSETLVCRASQLCRHNHCLIKICNHKPYPCAPESSFDGSLLMRNKPKRLIPIASLPLTFMQNR